MNADVPIIESTDETDLTPSHDEVLSALQILLASRSFRLAHAQKSFLEYTVKEVLAGRGSLIKEYLIATDALGREDSFDPRLDPIVRTQARKLRGRLAQYYENEGKGDPIRIEFRRGSYAPVFQRAPLPVLTEYASPIPERDDAVVERFAAPPSGKNSDPSAQGPPARRHTTEELARSSGGALDPGPVVREFLKSQPQTRLINRGRVILAIVVFTGLLAGIRALWKRSISSSDTPPSVAVLPFTDLSDGEPSDQVITDGLTEEIIKLLQEVPGLRVAGRISSFNLRSKTRDLKDVGATLHVRNVLIGTVKKRSSRFLITVQLNGVDGSHVWSGAYDRTDEDAQSIPKEISTAVVDALGVLSPGARTLKQQVQSTSSLPTPGAHEDYLRGIFFWHKLDADSLKLATQYLQQAIQKDPSYARAYTALADCYVVAPQVIGAPPASVVDKIRAAAATALTLDKTLGDAHIDLAVAAEFNFDWRDAEREFQKGLELSPGSVVGHLWYAKYLAIVGRKDEVFAQRNLAAQLDPVSPYAILSVGGSLTVAGRYEEAIRYYRSALSLEPEYGLAHQGLGLTYLAQGKVTDGIEELRLADKVMRGPVRRALLGYAYARSGDTEKARAILNQFMASYNHQPIPALTIAQIYVGLGDKNRAFEWLRLAVQERDLNLDLKWDPIWKPILSDPRCQQLLHSMKLT